MNGRQVEIDDMGLQPKKVGATLDPRFTNRCALSGRILKTFQCTNEFLS